LFFFGNSNGYSGNYVASQRMIFINDKAYSYEDTFWHEIGHYIYNEKLTDNERNHWNLLYENSATFITAYAKTNEKEDFDGSMVYEATLAGETDKVIRHCTNDCRSLFKLYQKLNGVLLKRGRRDLNYARGVY